MTGTVQRELLLQRGWDLGLVVLKEEGGFLSLLRDFLEETLQGSARTGVLPGLRLLPGSVPWWL